VLKEQLEEANLINSRLDEEVALLKRTIQSEKNANQYSQHSVSLLQSEVPFVRSFIASAVATGVGGANTNASRQ